ncbi:hypothetical protein FRX31_022124 [Thalictrum thalictroides]|uniref:Uncharacterized protein n=1 Tax=Thalictrum thalictroides TaxID=46969 RepID=A0A7J6VVU2_THATH|nr:hypothetical protein FRX31_022124 [Thalictrum thalictroides]
MQHGWANLNPTVSKLPVSPQLTLYRLYSQSDAWADGRSCTISEKHSSTLLLRWNFIDDLKGLQLIKAFRQGRSSPPLLQGITREDMLKSYKL